MSTHKSNQDRLDRLDRLYYYDPHKRHLAYQRPTKRYVREPVTAVEVCAVITLLVVDLALLVRLFLVS